MKPAAPDGRHADDRVICDTQMLNRASLIRRSTAKDTTRYNMWLHTELWDGQMEHVMQQYSGLDG